jgi:hypothetical protein
MNVSSGLATALAHAVGEANQSLVGIAPRTKRRRPKTRCDLCGNDYEGAMEIRLRGKVGIFDCFECAVHAMAPICERCGCRIIGHGVETAGRMYCCSHCARV